MTGSPVESSTVESSTVGSSTVGSSTVQPGVEELVALLRQDPVVIDDRFGNGETAQVTDELEALVASAEHPTYVVLAPAPEGVSAGDPAGDLAAQLHDRLGGGDATFAIHLGADVPATEVVGFGDAPGEGEVFDATIGYSAGGGDPDDVPSAVGIVARDLRAALEGDDLSEDEWESYGTQAPWAESDVDVLADYPQPGGSLLVTTLLAVVAAGVVLLLAQRLPTIVALYRGRPVTPGETPKVVAPRRSVRDADAPTVRATLDAALNDLADAVAADLGAVEDGDVVTLVTGSQDTARRVADATGRDHDDLPDLLGALVLTRIARKALDDARHHRDPSPYRACLIDPRHGRAKQERSLPVADRTLAAPVCGGCAQSAPDELRPLRVAPGRFGGARPYLETDSVWARTGYGAFTDPLWREVARELDRTADGAHR